MTNKEKNELNAWIAENIFNWTEIEENPFYPNPRLMGVNLKQGKTKTGNCGSKWGIPNYIDSEVMLVLEKCLEKVYPNNINLQKGKTYCRVWLENVELDVMEEILSIAICLFAKELFSRKF